MQERKGIMPQVIGFKRYEFTSKEGAQVTGVTFHAVEEIKKDGQGFASIKFSLSNQFLDRHFQGKPETLLKQEVNLLYNQYGKIAEVQLLSN